MLVRHDLFTSPTARSPRCQEYPPTSSQQQPNGPRPREPHVLFRSIRGRDKISAGKRTAAHRSLVSHAGRPHSRRQANSVLTFATAVTSSHGPRLSYLACLSRLRFPRLRSCAALGLWPISVGVAAERKARRCATATTTSEVWSAVLAANDIRYRFEAAPSRDTRPLRGLQVDWRVGTENTCQRIFSGWLQLGGVCSRSLRIGWCWMSVGKLRSQRCIFRNKDHGPHRPRPGGLHVAAAHN
ncbi:hypothetical protein B0T14DRAFT_193879 [Immersiella caudata]|uniref:Uncharacterized protein n=1 Tax=Immersiella caudata TaxID=314043 RepID=A0AA39WZ00_9PEZI|nr:hypothetical protein B0T14DRAFT_193879 [Immersiella caudata]